MYSRAYRDVAGDEVISMLQGLCVPPNASKRSTLPDRRRITGWIIRCPSSPRSCTVLWDRILKWSAFSNFSRQVCPTCYSDSLASPLLAALYVIESSSKRTPSLKVEHLDVSVLIGQGSNPVRIPAGFCFKFQKCIDVVYKESSTRFATILAYSIFVDFVNFEYLVPLGDRQFYFVDDPRALQGPFAV